MTYQGQTEKKLHSSNASYKVQDTKQTYKTQR